jgi:5-methylcytosine-specific restriction endonuclease McrA
LQVHHKKERYKGGDDSPKNLELLCPNCHAAHHLGRSLYKKKKML